MMGTMQCVTFENDVFEYVVSTKHEASKPNNWFEDELFNLFQRLTEMQTLIHGHSPENGNIVLVSEGL